MYGLINVTGIALHDVGGVSATGAEVVPEGMVALAAPELELVVPPLEVADVVDEPHAGTRAKQAKDNPTIVRRRRACDESFLATASTAVDEYWAEDHSTTDLAIMPADDPP